MRWEVNRLSAARRGEEGTGNRARHCGVCWCRVGRSFSPERHALDAWNGSHYTMRLPCFTLSSWQGISFFIS